MKRTATPAFLAVLLFTSICLADTLILKNGAKFEGQLVRKDETYVYFRILKLGEQRFRRSDVLRIEKGESPEAKAPRPTPPKEERTDKGTGSELLVRIGRVKPRNGHPYSDGTRAQFARLLATEEWHLGKPLWNPQGMLEAVHVCTGLVFVLVPEGRLMMGAKDGKAWEKPAHRVRLSAFLLCRTECSQAAWDRVGGSDERHRRGASLPIEGVSWKDCRSWCGKAGLRLPTESEWEYACRAGTTTRYSCGEANKSLQGFANIRDATYDRDQRKRLGSSLMAVTREVDDGHVGSAPVGSFKPNQWGFLDIHGNVFEWCEDRMHANYAGAPTDGRAWITGGKDNRVLRSGGSGWCAEDARSAARQGSPATWRNETVGLRPAATLPE